MLLHEICRLNTCFLWSYAQQLYTKCHKISSMPIEGEQTDIVQHIPKWGDVSIDIRSSHTFIITGTIYGNSETQVSTSIRKNHSDTNKYTNIVEVFKLYQLQTPQSITYSKTKPRVQVRIWRRTLHYISPDVNWLARSLHYERMSLGRPPLFGLDTWHYDKTKTDHSAAIC